MVVSRKPDDEVPQYELVCDRPDKGAYDGLDEVGIGLLDEGVFDGHAEEVGTSMPGERVFDGHDEVGTDMSGERAFDGHDEVGTGMPGEGVCDGPDEVGNDRPDKGVCDGPDEVGDLHDEVGNCRPDKGVCDGPDEVSDLHDEVGNGRPDKGLCDGLDEVVDLPGERGNGTSKVTKRAADRPVERVATEENDELVEIDYEQEEEDITVDTRVDPTGDWDFLRNPEIPPEECGSGFEFDCEDDDLRSFGDFDDNDDDDEYYRARTKAKELIQGSIKDQYSKLWEYCAEVRRMNPWSSVIMKCSLEDKAANSKFAQVMEKMKSESVAAYEWLVEKYHVHWSRAYFKDTAVIERLKLESSIYHPEYSGDFHYQVRGPGDDQYIVDIEKKTCACNMWQLIGIPCIHGISVLLSSNCDPIDYIHNKYKKENFIKAYALVIYGINGPMMWPKTNDMPLECPLFKKQRGAVYVNKKGTTRALARERGGGNLDGSETRQGSTQVEGLQASQGSNQAHGFQSSQECSLTKVSPATTNSKKRKRMNSI
ncbi:hypothetical protein QYF36_014456 [Acer negundo]|nr:hypothetical protein QYF36_014456 [Acer negundo]